MLPLSGSDPTIAGYNEWLNEVSQMHLDSKGWDGTVGWNQTNWKFYFEQGHTPEEALMAQSVYQTNNDAKEYIRVAKNIRNQLNKSIES